jgi:hypothetical protein
MPGSADFIIDIAGAKLRSQLASADAILFFALRRSSWMLDRPADLKGNKGPTGPLIAESAFFPHCSCIIRGVLVWRGYTRGA